MKDAAELAEAIREARLATAALNEKVQALPGYLPRTIPVEDVKAFAKHLYLLLWEDIEQTTHIHTETKTYSSSFGNLSREGVFGNKLDHFPLNVSPCEDAVQNLVRAMTGYMGDFND